jgi:hypothetical protein
LDKNTYEIRFCELISASLVSWESIGPVDMCHEVHKVHKVQRVRMGRF